MNNNTKIRLHLSKNLFESVAREVLAEAKRANDGYTVAVKQPKMPKQSKSQAVSPEVQKTDAEATMGEMETKVAETAPVKEDMSAAQMLVATLGTVLGVGGTIAASVLKDLKNAKTPEEKKQVLQSLANQMTKAKGIDEVKEEE
jgi:hypothetical protein